MTTPAGGVTLPELPRPQENVEVWDEEYGSRELYANMDYYTADQMREYARAALAGGRGVPDVLSAHAIITPNCRANRGLEGAADEALRRIRNTYMLYAPDAANAAVDWHVKLIRVEPKKPAAPLPKEPGR